MTKRKARTRYQQIAAAVAFEYKLNAKLIRVFRKYNKIHFTFQHNETGKKWTTTLSKLENYGHNKFKATKDKKHYWAHPEWKEAGDKSNNFDGYKVYIIICTHTVTKEEFYKIGRTFQIIEGRFSKDFPYEYKLKRMYKGTAKEMCDLERHLHTLNKHRSYIPKIKFSGMSECFTSVQTHDGIMFFNGLETFGGPFIPLKECNADQE